jgi:8-oxo-dGTP diphosphatase
MSIGQHYCMTLLKSGQNLLGLMNKKRILVACAIILCDDKVLVVQRSEQMAHPLQWEFPGGKVESHETPEACIIREIKEELHLDICVFKQLDPVVHDYQHITVELIPFICRQVSGSIYLSEHKSFRLLSTEAMMDLDWVEADLPIVLTLQSMDLDT